MIDKPGIYNIPLADYIADPCPTPSLSAGVAHALVSQSPLHAWAKHPRLNPAYERDDTSQTDIGTIAHALLLDKNISRVVVIDAEDWRTKAAKEARDAARTAGKLPVLKHKMGQIEAMVKAAEEAINNSEIAAAFNDGKPEQTMVWNEAGVWIKSRPDWISNDGLVICDYKTTQGSAEPNNWMRNVMLACGNDMQAVIAMRGHELLRIPSPARPATFVFMVQETEPPYAMSFVSLTPAFLKLACDKLSRAMVSWKACLASGQWPSYPSRICYLEPPAWMQMEQLQAEEILP